MKNNMQESDLQPDPSCGGAFDALKHMLTIMQAIRLLSALRRYKGFRDFCPASPGHLEAKQNA